MSLSLDEKFVLKAQNELRETEELKSLKLKEFRLWLSKHDYFKESRQGETLNYSKEYINLIYLLFRR
jgi:hypothetical protein